VQEQTTIGAEFVHALAAKDRERMLALLDPEIDFRALTPNRFWEAADRDTVTSVMLGDWFEEKDVIRSLEALETDTVCDRQRVGYRFAVTNPDGEHLVEQQAYLSVHDGRIDWMRVLCSGFRPVAAGD
jgi:hypothetical protein